MPALPKKLLLLVVIVVTAAGCKPKIGDACQISTDCSAAGDRLCDITARGGYCTVYNCEPGACPEDESLCIQFAWESSRACVDQTSPSPYARSFCMASCESDSDCRAEYICADLSNPETNPYGALLIDRDRGHRACLARDPAALPSPEAASNVCSAELPSSEPAPSEPDPTAGTGGSSSTSNAGAAGAADGGAPANGGAPAAAGEAGAAGQGGAGG